MGSMTYIRVRVREWGRLLEHGKMQLTQSSHRHLSQISLEMFSQHGPQTQFPGQQGKDFGGERSLRFLADTEGRKQGVLERVDPWGPEVVS